MSFKSVSFFMFLALLVSCYSFPWGVTYAPQDDWRALTSTANGTVVYAAVFPGYLYVSKDSGLHWEVLRNEDLHYNGLATSFDGQYIYTSIIDGGVLRSIDGGKEWTTSYSPTRNSWGKIATSGDGKYVTLCGSSTFFFSVDYGYSFLQVKDLSGYFTSTAINNNGSVIVVCTQYDASDGFDGGIWYSHDFGVSWISSSAPTKIYWHDIAVSSTGQYVVAASTGSIYFSKDFGVSFVSTKAPPNIWNFIAISHSGEKVIATTGSYASTGLIYTSSNFSLDWTQESAPKKHYVGVSSDSSGEKLVAISGDMGQIYINQITSAPTISPTVYNYAPNSNVVGTSLTVGGIIGVVLGVLAAFIMVAAIIYCYYEKHYNNNDMNIEKGSVKPLLPEEYEKKKRVSVAINKNKSKPPVINKEIKDYSSSPKVSEEDDVELNQVDESDL